MDILGINLSPEMLMLIALAVVILFPQLSTLISSTSMSRKSGESSNAARLYFWEKLAEASKDNTNLLKKINELRKDLVLESFPPEEEKKV